MAYQADEAVFLPVLPSFRDLGKAIKQGASSPATLRAAADGGKAGGKAYGDGFSTSADGGLSGAASRLRDSRGRFVKAGADVGRATGKSLGDSMAAEVDKAARSGGFGARLFAGFKTGAASAITAVGAVGVAAGGLGIKTAAGMENARIAFTTMLDSAEDADKFLRKLEKFAKSTPFEFPELQEAAASLVSAGVESSKVIPIMRSLGNATSGMGTGAEGVKRATVALQQMNAAGRITGEDLNQLRDAGIPVYRVLAAATGKSKKEVTALAQEGKLGAKELRQMMKALEQGKGLEKFAGLMDKQSASLNGLWSTLKDTFTQGMATAVQPLIPLIKDGLNKAIKVTADVMPKVADGLERLVKGGKKLAASDNAKAAVSGIKSALTSLWATLSKIDFASIWAGLKPVRTALADLWDAIRNVDFASIWASLAPIRTALTDLWDTVRGIDPASAAATFAPIGTALSGLWDTLSSIDPAVIKGAIDTVVDAVGKLGTSASDGLASLPALKPTIDAAGSAFAFLADHMDEVGKALPILLGGFAAYKGLQVANNAVGKDSLVGFGLQLSSTLALTIANRSLASSIRSSSLAQEQATVATTGSTLARARSTLATIAQTVASRTAAAASKVFAAGQWLVNAALAANPIGLIIAGLVLLVAGIVLAWKRSETFRKIVLGVWSAIKTGAAAAFGWLRKAIPAVLLWARIKWLTLRAALLAPIQAAGRLIAAAIEKVRADFKAVTAWASTAFRAAWAKTKEILTHPIDSARSAISTILGKLRNKFSTQVDAIAGAWDRLKSALAKPIDFVVNTVLENGLLASFRSIAKLVGLDGLADKMHVSWTMPKLRNGGEVTGPGTSTSDSILGVDRRGIPTALVSAKEYVVNALSYAKNRALVHAINAGETFDYLPRRAAGGVVWPTNTRALSGNYAGHSGVDIRAGMGAPIYAATAGTVTHAGYGKGYGQAIFERAVNGLMMVYGHTSALLARVGQQLSAGQLIGKVGATGNASGPHLHFEVAPGGHFGRAGNRATTLAWLDGADIAAGDSSGGSVASVDQGGIFAGLAKAALSKLSGIGGGIAGQIIAGLPGMLVGGLKSAISGALGGSGSAGSAGGGGNRGLGQRMLAAAGYGAGQWAPLDSLWTRESGWNVNALNKSSGAYGIPQALPGSKMAAAGSDWRTNAATQIRWGLGYIKDRYGTPAAAWDHSQRTGWYDNGGILRPGFTAAFNGTGKPERVLTDPQWQALSRASSGRTFQFGDVRGFTVAEVVDEFTARLQQADALAVTW